MELKHYGVPGMQWKVHKRRVPEWVINQEQRQARQEALRTNYIQRDAPKTVMPRVSGKTSSQSIDSVISDTGAGSKSIEELMAEMKRNEEQMETERQMVEELFKEVSEEEKKVRDHNSQTTKGLVHF